VAYKEFVAFSKKLTSIDPNEMISVGVNTIDAKDAVAVPNKDGQKIAKIPAKIRKYVKERYPKGIPNDGPSRERNILRESLFKLLLLPGLAQAVKAYMPKFCDHDYYEDDEIEEFLAEVEKETKRTRYKPTASARSKTGSPASFIESFEKHHADNIQFAYALYYWFYEKIREPRYIKIIDEHLFGYGRSLGSVLGKVTYWGQTDEQVDQRVSKLQDHFYGRKDELLKLDDFLESKESGLIIVSAPAGSGKSALLANWQQHRYEQGDKVALHFISNQYPTTTEAQHILGNLLHQVWCHAGKDSDDLPYGVLDGVGQSLSKELVAYSKDQGRLIVVLDGLDEADGLIEPFIEAGCLPENVFVVVSARQDSEDMPPSLIEWEKRGAKEPNSLLVQLEGLAEPDVAAWLANDVGELSANAQKALAKALRATTEGLPLFLYYVIGDLRRNLPELPNNDARLEFIKTMPAPFPKYIAEQIRKLSEATEERLQTVTKLWTDGVEKLFATLSVIMGPIHRDDLKSLLGSECPNFTALDHRLSRWFSIRQGNYSFAHPRLARAFAQVIGLSESEIKEDVPAKNRTTEDAEDVLIDWMEEAWKPKEMLRGIRRGASYALDWLPEHLAALGIKGQQDAALIIANPDFLDERLRQNPDLAATRLAKNCDLWASLPSGAKQFEGAIQWTAFWGENETSLKRASMGRQCVSCFFADVVRNCLGDAMTAGSGIVPPHKALKPQSSINRGLTRSINNAHKHGVSDVLSVDDGYISWGRNAIRFWDKQGNVTDGGDPKAHRYAIAGVLPTEDGYVSWGENTIRLWDKLGNAIKACDPTAHEDHVIGILPTTNGYVSWGFDGGIRFWDKEWNVIKGGNPVAHEGYVRKVLRIEDGYISWGGDGAIRFWDNNGRATDGGDPKAHEGGVTGVLSIDDGYVSWGKDGAIRFWNKQGAIISVGIEAHQHGVSDVFSTADGLISWGREGAKLRPNGAIRFWNKRGNSMISSDPKIHQGSVGGVLPVEDGYISWGSDGFIRFWDKQGATMSGGIEAHKYGVSDVLPIDDGFISWGSDGAIRFWDNNGKATGGGDLKAHEGGVNGVLPTDDGFISWGSDGTISFWDKGWSAMNGSDQNALLSEIGTIGILITEHGLIGWGKDDAICFLDKEGKAIGGDALNAHEGGVKGVLLVGAGYVSWGGDDAIRFWDKDGNTMNGDSLSAHKGGVNGVLSTENGYISWGNDGAIHFWDKDGKATDGGDIKAHEGKRGVVDVLSIGNDFISWGKDGIIRFWNISGQLLNILVPPGGIFFLYIADDKLIIRNRTVWVYPLI